MRIYIFIAPHSFSPEKENSDIWCSHTSYQSPADENNAALILFHFDCFGAHFHDCC
jgi:hypothetical protein